MGLTPRYTQHIILGMPDSGELTPGHSQSSEWEAQTRELCGLCGAGSVAPRRLEKHGFGEDAVGRVMWNAGRPLKRRCKHMLDIGRRFDRNWVAIVAFSVFAECARFATPSDHFRAFFRDGRPYVGGV